MKSHNVLKVPLKTQIHDADGWSRGPKQCYTWIISYQSSHLDPGSNQWCASKCSQYLRELMNRRESDVLHRQIVMAKEGMALKEGKFTQEQRGPGTSAQRRCGCLTPEWGPGQLVQLGASSPVQEWGWGCFGVPSNPTTLWFYALFQPKPFDNL